MHIYTDFEIHNLSRWFHFDKVYNLYYHAAFGAIQKYCLEVDHWRELSKKPLSVNFFFVTNYITLLEYFAVAMVKKVSFWHWPILTSRPHILLCCFAGRTGLIMHHIATPPASWSSVLVGTSGVFSVCRSDKACPTGVMATDRERLEQLKKIHGFREPDRGNLDDNSIEWRTGKPDYAKANLAFVLGKTQNHETGTFSGLV